MFFPVMFSFSRSLFASDIIESISGFGISCFSGMGLKTSVDEEMPRLKLLLKILIISLALLTLSRLVIPDCLE